MAKKKYPDRNNSPEVLLDFDGERYYFEDGYWTKFEVRRVDQANKFPME